MTATTPPKPTHTSQGQKPAGLSPQPQKKQDELLKEFDKGLAKELEKKQEATSSTRTPLRPNRPESRIRIPPGQIPPEAPFYELGEGSELYPIPKPTVDPRAKS